MGVVYEAIDRERGETVAVKTLLNVSPGALYRFKREFRLLADVTHPNLIALHELFFEGEQIFFSMEYVDGLGFVEYVRGSDSEDGPEDPEIRHERLRAALRQLAAGLGGDPHGRDAAPRHQAVERAADARGSAGGARLRAGVGVA
jgi:serine/threonine protein kinase